MLNAGDNIIIEDNQRTLAYKDVEGNFDFFCALTTKNAFKSNLVEIFLNYLKSTKTKHELYEKISIATQEAFSNALLWNNLQIPKEKLAPYRTNLPELIDEKLSSSKTADLPLILSLQIKDRIVEVNVESSGKDFDWGLQKDQRTDEHRGMSLIKKTCDKVVSSNNGRKLSMFFYIN